MCYQHLTHRLEEGVPKSGQVVGGGGDYEDVAHAAVNGGRYRQPWIEGHFFL